MSNTAFSPECRAARSGEELPAATPVATIIEERAPRTLLLALCAALVQALIGVTAGVIAAANKKRRVDRAAVALSLLGVSAPTFPDRLALQWLLAVKLRIFPIDGYGETTSDHLAGVVLPAMTSASSARRITRASSATR